MRIAVKTWWYKKEQMKAMQYRYTLVWDKIFDEEKDPLHADEPIGYLIQGVEVRETEKAKNLLLDVWNRNRYHRLANDVPVESKWKTWIPKSAVLDVRLHRSLVDDCSYAIWNEK